MANTKRCTYDWESVRLDYETGMLTFREMSASHGMAISSIHKYAKTHDWSRVDKSKLHKGAQQKTYEECLRELMKSPYMDEAGRVIDVAPVSVEETEKD